MGGTAGGHCEFHRQSHDCHVENSIIIPQLVENVLSICCLPAFTWYFALSSAEVQERL